jgi:hypothetical protein
MRSFRSAFALLTLVVLASALPAVSEAGRPSSGSGGVPRGALQLTDINVVPGPGDAGASAYMTVKVGRDAVTFSTTVTGTAGYITTIGIYQGWAGQTGPMVVRLCPNEIGIAQLLGTVPVSTDICRAISRNPAGYYVQINTSAFPDGALRAQMH